jgi:hypothetical protein
MPDAQKSQYPPLNHCILILGLRIINGNLAHSDWSEKYGLKRKHEGIIRLLGM